MSLAASGLTIVALLCGMSAAAAAERQTPTQPAFSVSPGTTDSQDGLRTFTLDKPLTQLEAERTTERSPRVAFRLPRDRDTVRTTVGLGYVQGADWGSELLAAGDFRGIQVQSSALVTKGRSGFVLDNGTLSLFDPDRQWRVEAGDVFSNLRGASRGARLSWRSAGNRHPAVSIYGPRRGLPNRSTVVSYRDQLLVAGQTLADLEVASDKSYLFRTRLAAKRLETEASYRSNRNPVPGSDISVFVGLTTWRGISISGGVLRSFQHGERSEWRTVFVRLPASRFFSITLERGFTDANDTSSRTAAAMVSFSAGQLRLFHRYQFGEYERVRPGFADSFARQQNQSMASYAPARRVNLNLQLATQRTETGILQHWEELQTSINITRLTTLRLVTSVPDVGNPERFRGYFRQELPARFALQADYGRLSAFQDVPFELDRSRFKVMLYKTWHVGTPARGAEVRGRVIDHTGRPVPGARVKLGPYAIDTDRKGGYLFRNVPRGEYDLTLDPEYLPADYAWDGRRLPLTLAWSSQIDADLLVAPLNAIHGRVYVDRNSNGRFDSGEEVAGAIIQLENRVTAADASGAYSFYNLWPGRYRLRILQEKLPALESDGAAELEVELSDSRPVTDADFRMKPRAKPIIFNRIGK